MSMFVGLRKNIQYALISMYFKMSVFVEYLVCTSLWVVGQHSLYKLDSKPVSLVHWVKGALGAMGIIKLVSAIWSNVLYNAFKWQTWIFMHAWHISKSYNSVCRNIARFATADALASRRSGVISHLSLFDQTMLNSLWCITFCLDLTSLTYLKGYLQPRRNKLAVVCERI